MFPRWLCLLALAPLAQLATAHHAPTAIFDMAKRITVTGTLAKINWVNPHIVVTIDDAQSNGAGKKEAWTMESNPPAWFRRVGVNRSDFAKFTGQPITIECVRARDGSAYGYMQKITFPDKTVLELVVEQGH